MAALTGAQRTHLRGLAHGLKPLVQIGKDGLTEGVVRAIDAALEARELIKVKIGAEREEREELVPIVEARLRCECVGTVGHMAVFFRRQPDPDKRKIALPEVSAPS